MAFHNNQMYFNMGPNHHPDPQYLTYMANMMNRFHRDYERRRRQDLFPTPEAEMNLLTVEKIEFYAKDNATQHHTDQFEVINEIPPTPVLRRGQPFYIAVKFDKTVDMKRDIIRLTFNFGPKPSVSKGTRAIFQVNENDKLEEDKWDARAHGVNGEILALQINIPATAPVGLWNLSIQTSSVGTSAFKNYRCKQDIYILFNPWIKEDGVYMEEEDLRDEYVLNDTGKVYMGSYLKPKGRRWFYGQFDDVVLPAAIHLLEKSGLNHSDRGNPILMARAISAVINSEDEDGLIEGRWVGDFTDGTSPFAWTGSVAILEKYLKNNGKSVKYGQCWVFSGAAVTICRALGIPARPVTNYVSAHDTNRSLTVDKYFTRDGVEIEGGPDGDCYDSCWNFHVWVDVWMKRPDLPPEFSGWQVIDSTPQELSDNAYKCGPCPVEAIRRGEIGLSYDTPFAFAAVNADIFHFQEDRDSTWGFSRLNFDNSHVGKKLVTKKVGADDDDENICQDMEDLTLMYKNPEGSDTERLAVFNAIRGFEKTRLQYNLALPCQEDVKFTLREIDTIPFGQPFRVIVHIENMSNESRTINATMAANSVFYTGTTAHLLKKATGKMILKPNHKEVMHISITPDIYLDKMVDHNIVKIYAIANVKETKQSWSKEDDFPFLKPTINIAITGDLKVGSECEATFSFKNPIDRRLTECTISVEGTGLQRPKVSNFRDVEPNEDVIFKETFYPKKSGSRKIMASFNSKIMTGVIGSTTIEIAD